MIAVKTENLRKEYKDIVAVSDINIEVEEGRIFALLGVNGAGKSTLIKMLTTVLKPTSGDAFIFGNSVIKSAEKVRDLIDVSFQETSIARKLTVKENIEFYAKLCGKRKEETEMIKDELYAEFGFKKTENKRAEKLSGGWQRKLSIALSLVKNPRVLFLDEPTLGLDVIARRDLWAIIKRLKGKTTVILTTHYMEEAEELSDALGIISEGKLLFAGSKSELYLKTGENTVEKAFIKTVGETL